MYQCSPACLSDNLVRDFENMSEAVTWPTKIDTTFVCMHEISWLQTSRPNLYPFATKI